MLNRLFKRYRTNTHLTATQDMSLAEYCTLRMKQWESQATKQYGPVMGAAVVADDEGWRQWEAFQLDQLLVKITRLLDCPTTRVLDFGCGVGRVLKPLQTIFGRVDGVDVAPTVLIGAQEYCPDGTTQIIMPQEFRTHSDSSTSLLFTCNGYELPKVPDAYYTFVYSVVCLIHVLHPGVRHNLYREFYRILQPGGGCCLMFFISRSQNFGRADQVSLNYGAFAFESLQDIRHEFEQTAFSIHSIDQYEPIDADRQGGVEKVAFVNLHKE